VHQFEFTPKALANFSPGFERSREPWGKIQNRDQTLKGLDSWRTLSGFNDYFRSNPKVVAVLQPWAEISQRLRRISNWCTIHKTGISRSTSFQCLCFSVA